MYICTSYRWRTFSLRVTTTTLIYADGSPKPLPPQTTPALPVQTGNGLFRLQLEGDITMSKTVIIIA